MPARAVQRRCTSTVPLVVPAARRLFFQRFDEAVAVEAGFTDVNYTESQISLIQAATLRVAFSLFCT